MAEFPIYEARRNVRVERVTALSASAIEAADVLILYRRNGSGDSFKEEWGRIAEAVTAGKAKDFPLGNAPVQSVADDPRGRGARAQRLREGDWLTVDMTDNDTSTPLQVTFAVEVSEADF